MIVRFTASNIVAMILFIPLLIALGLILAFIVPLLAVIVAAAGIIFLAIYTFARIGLVKKQVISESGSIELGGISKPAGKARKRRHVEIREYRVR